MKRIIYFLSFIFIISSFIACERDEDKVTIADPGTSGSLNNLSKTSYLLELDSASKVFDSFEWTEADFGFDASITYKVQMDLKSNHFSSPVTLFSVNNAYTGSAIIGDVNKALLDKQQEPEVPVDVEFRVEASVNPHADPIYSNVREVSIIPYQTVFPPIYILGAATGVRDSIEVRSFAPSKYYTIAYLTTGQNFRLFKTSEPTSDSYNYSFFTGFISDSLVNAGDADENYRLTTPTGYYAISVNLKTKTLDVDKVDEPVLYMTGQALGGWDWTTNYVKLSWQSHGIFTAETNFAQGESFRFFKQADWGDGYNYPSFGSVTPLLTNANDGDKNFKVVGATGMYKITCNLLDLTVTMEAAD
jgi:starch-binding outer membrane protein SusE/F